MCEGEFESLKAIHAVSPTFVPRPYAWGRYPRDEPETYFLLAEFRDVGEQVRNRYAPLLIVKSSNKWYFRLILFHPLRLLRATISVTLLIGLSGHLDLQFEFHYQYGRVFPFTHFLYSTSSHNSRVSKSITLLLPLIHHTDFKMSFSLSQRNLYS